MSTQARNTAFALKWALAWLPMVAIAIANGAARDLWYGAALGELRAHQVSTLTALALFGFYIWFAVRRLRPASMHDAWLGGALWLAMTLAFEFPFGHYVAGKPWSVLLENYNLAAGHWWPLILVWVCAAPPLFLWLRR